MSEPHAIGRTTALEANPSPGGDRSRWPSLAVLLAGGFMILLDATIVNVAIPLLFVLSLHLQLLPWLLL
jgi:hypothetical protein